MRTYAAKSEEAQVGRKWWVLDAKGLPLGRLASEAAALLRGKHKASFTPHVDMGDFVVIVNAGSVAVTGRKADDKMYYDYSGYPGGMREESFRHLSARKPGAPLLKAVKGMLPKNKLGREMVKKLKIYATAEHPHGAQKPEFRKLAGA
jgi:large subunit ribosomal protein L13